MTPNQQRIMIYIANCVDATAKQTTEYLRITPADFRACVPELIDDGFLRKGREPGRHVCSYSLTDDGKTVAKRLARYQHSSTGPINCERLRPMTAPEYVPPAWGYMRNSGHGHIASRGLM